MLGKEEITVCKHGKWTQGFQQLQVVALGSSQSSQGMDG